MHFSNFISTHLTLGEEGALGMSDFETGRTEKEADYGRVTRSWQNWSLSDNDSK